MSALGKFTHGLASGIETGSQIRSRNAAAQELEDRVRRQREEDENAKGDLEIGGKFFEGAMIPEGMEVGAFLDQQIRDRNVARDAAAKQAEASSLGGRVRSAVAGALTRNKVREVGAGVGVTGVPGVPGPVGPPPVAAEPVKMRPMTAREAAEGRMLSAMAFNRKADREKLSTDFVRETHKEAANEIIKLPAEDMGAALSRYSGSKVEVIPNKREEGKEQTYKFVMDGKVEDEAATRGDIARMAGDFVDHDLEGAFKTLSVIRQERAATAVNAERLKAAQLDYQAKKQALDTTKEIDPIRIRQLKAAEQAAAETLKRQQWANQPSMWSLDPVLTESVLTEEERDPKNQKNPYYWVEEDVLDAKGQPMLDGQGKPMKRMVSKKRKEWEAQMERVRTHPYTNYIVKKFAPDGSATFVLNDARGVPIQGTADTNFNAVAEIAEGLWGPNGTPRIQLNPGEKRTPNILPPPTGKSVGPTGVGYATPPTSSGKKAGLPRRPAGVPMSGVPTGIPVRAGGG